MPALLDGLRILVLEDEFLIAMDVEQLCRDHGAAEVTIAREIAEIDGQALSARFDAAVVDLMLGGVSTLDFAVRLRSEGIPFVFASGYSDLGRGQGLFSGCPAGHQALLGRRSDRSRCHGLRPGRPGLTPSLDLAGNGQLKPRSSL
ncbi:hypothetical protein ACVOMV_03395 [Mesorhizobium atlanticum]